MRTPLNLRGVGLLGLERIWQALPSTWRRHVLFSANDRFLVGVIGLIADERDRLLVLRHRFRTPWPLGLPGGFVHHEEELPEALVRELREETGIEVDLDPMPFDTELNVQTRALSVTFVARAKHVPVPLRLTSEIIDGRFFAKDEVPSEVYPHHRQTMFRYWAR